MVPAGIGVVRGRRDPDRPAYVLPGRCTAPVATHEPTGVLELLRDRRLTLGDLFAVWGRRLTPRRLLGFPGRVRAYVDGRRQGGDPRAIALRAGGQVVLAVGPAVPVHARYRFPSRVG